MGRLAPGQGRARLPLEQDKPTDQTPCSPAQKECSCLMGRLAWPSPQLLTSRQRQLLRTETPGRLLLCGGREEAPEQKATTLPPLLPPA